MRKSSRKGFASWGLLWGGVCGDFGGVWWIGIISEGSGLVGVATLDPTNTLDPTKSLDRNRISLTATRSLTGPRTSSGILLGEMYTSFAAALVDTWIVGGD